MRRRRWGRIQEGALSALRSPTRPPAPVSFKPIGHCDDPGMTDDQRRRLAAARRAPNTFGIKAGGYTPLPTGRTTATPPPAPADRGGDRVTARPEERIEPMLDALREVWLRHPDQRLGQVIGNAARHPTKTGEWGEALYRDPFNVEDDEMWAGLRKLANDDV